MRKKHLTKKRKELKKQEKERLLLWQKEVLKSRAKTDKVSRQQESLGCAFSSLLILCAFLIIAYQVYHWLKYGEWFPITLSKVTPSAPQLEAWSLNPTSWISLNKFIRIVYRFIAAIPLSFFLMFLSIIIFLATDRYKSDRLRDEH